MRPSVFCMISNKKSCDIYWERGANCSMFPRWLLVNGNRVWRPILTPSAVNRSVYLSQRSRRPPVASTLASVFTTVLLYVGVTDAHAGSGYWLSGTPTSPGADSRELWLNASGCVQWQQIHFVRWGVWPRPVLPPQATFPFINLQD